MEEKEKKIMVNPEAKAEVLKGYKFGFGFFLAGLTVWLLIIFLAVVLFYVFRAFGLM